MTGLDNVNEDPDAIEFVRFQKYEKDGSYRAIFKHEDADGFGSVKCPYGQPGDLLWVRETFFDTRPFKQAPLFQNGNDFYYKADGSFIGDHKWKPSIHMPKVAARIWLQVEEIRVERLNEISEEDAIAEGVSFITRTSGICYMDYNIIEYVYPITAKQSFKSLFLSINKKPSPNRERGNYGNILSYTAIAWDQEDFNENWAKYKGIYRNKTLKVNINPWVWVVKYKVLSTTGKTQICYKTNDICKYDCKGLCRESM